MKNQPATLPQKKIFVTELALGDVVDDFFLLSGASQFQAKNGPYWRLEFRDNSGAIPGKIWSPMSLAFPELSAGSMVWVNGRVSSYRDTLELSIEGMQILDDIVVSALALSDFIPASPYPVEEMLEELREIGKSILHHKPLRKLFKLVLENEEVASALRIAPAAKAMHHAYAGGLLEHTLSVTRLCMDIAGRYPDVDRQLLFIGAVCHDLGKIWELTSGLSVDYTQTGRLLGHISIGLEKLSPMIKKSGLEPELTEHLQHLILSHHGTREFGSPVLPATRESLILHYADNIDAKMQQTANALSNVAEGEAGWSAYVPSLERYLFKPQRTPDGEGGKSSKKNGPAEQPLPLISQCSLLSKE